MNVGDTVKVHVHVREGERERIWVFEGLVVALRRHGPRPSFTVRKVSFGQGVERIFPLSSPTIQRIEVLRSAKVRRAKLYYLRNLKGRAAKMRASVGASSALEGIEGLVRAATEDQVVDPLLAAAEEMVRSLSTQRGSQTGADELPAHAPSSGAPASVVQALRIEADDLLQGMQRPKSLSGMRQAFAADSRALGEAALAAARLRD